MSGQSRRKGLLLRKALAVGGQARLQNQTCFTGASPAAAHADPQDPWAQLPLQDWPYCSKPWFPHAVACWAQQTAKLRVPTVLSTLQTKGKETPLMQGGVQPADVSARGRHFSKLLLLLPELPAHSFLSKIHSSGTSPEQPWWCLHSPASRANILMPAQGHWCWSTVAQTCHTDVCQVLGKRLALLRFGRMGLQMISDNWFTAPVNCFCVA